MIPPKSKYFSTPPPSGRKGSTCELTWPMRSERSGAGEKPAGWYQVLLRSMSWLVASLPLSLGDVGVVGKSATSVGLRAAARCGFGVAIRGSVDADRKKGPVSHSPGEGPRAAGGVGGATGDAEDGTKKRFPVVLSVFIILSLVSQLASQRPAQELAAARGIRLCLCRAPRCCQSKLGCSGCSTGPGSAATSHTAFDLGGSKYPPLRARQSLTWGL